LVLNGGAAVYLKKKGYRDKWKEDNNHCFPKKNNNCFPKKKIIATSTIHGMLNRNVK
jgi:hypothetical protein